MAEQTPKDLESPLRMLELQIQNLASRFEVFNIEALDLRTRVESLEAWRRQIQESGNLGSDRRDFISEKTTKFERLGGMRKNDVSVYGTTTSKCLEGGEVADTVESKQEVERFFTLLENVKKKFVGFSPALSLLELETESRGTEDVTEDAGKSAYPKKGRQELLEESTEQENCGEIKVSENVRKVEKHLRGGMKEEEGFVKGTALLERHTVREAGEDKGEEKLEGAVERKEIQDEIVGNESKPDVCTHLGVGFVQMKETEEVLEKREGQTDEILTDDSLNEPKCSDDSECQLIEEPKGERVGKEVNENVEAKEVRMEKELDKWENKNKEALRKDETLKETEDVYEVQTEEENYTGMNEGNEIEDLGKTKDVGIKEKLDEFVTEWKDFFQIYEKAKGTDEIEGVRMKEGSNNNLSEKFKNLYIQCKFDLESKKESKNVQLELEKLNNIPDIFGKWKEPAKLSEKQPNKKTPIDILADIDEWTCGTSVDEDEISNHSAMPLNVLGKEEKEHDYDLELEELEECFEKSLLDPPDESERWISDEARTQEETVQSKVEEAVNMIISSIERDMNVSLPIDLTKQVGECVRNLVDSSQRNLKRKVQQIRNVLLSESRVRHSFQVQIRRLYQELIKKFDKENLYKDKIHKLHEEMNIVSNGLEAYKAECEALCKVSYAVTLNTELEMRKHRMLCDGYRTLIYEYESLKHRSERLAKRLGECEVDASQKDMETGDEKKCDESLVTLVEENLVSLSRSLELLKEKVLHVLEVQPIVRELKMEKAESSEELDECRSELLQYLKNKSSSHVQLIEELLKKDRKKHDYFWNGVLNELKLSLHEVAKSECPLLTGLLLHYGANCRAADDKGNTALHIAARNGRVCVGTVLLDAGCFVDATNSLKLTPLYQSLYYGHVNFSLLLIRAGANVHVRDRRKMTPLHLAALSGNLVAVQALIDSNADVNAVDANGDTPLFNAAIFGDSEIGTLLIKAGARVTATNGVGSLPLHVAAWEGKFSFCSLLLNHQSPVDAINLHNVTPLHLAAMEDHALIVQLLINRGANVNALEENIDSPLHYAAKFGNLFMVKSLIYAGADICATNFYKITPLHYAASAGHSEVCSLLLEKESDVNARDIKGRTPLHLAAMCAGDIATATFLILWGADMTAVDSDGSTPLGLVCEAENRSFAKWLGKQVLAREKIRGEKGVPNIDMPSM